MKTKIKKKNFLEDDGDKSKKSNPPIPDMKRNPSAQKKTDFMEGTVKDGKRYNPK